MIQQIDRLDDPRVAAYAHVGDPAWLLANRLFVAEGRLIVRRLFELARYEVESVLVAPAALAALADVLPDSCVVYVADPPLLAAITGFNFHRGCLALVRRPSDVTNPLGVPPPMRLIGLEGVGNPDNVGGIFRVAAAFGVDGVLIDPTTADPLYRKAIRTSMGAVLQVPFARAEPWPQALSGLKDDGFRVLALTPHGDARPLDDVARQPPARWIVLAGAEGPGLSEAALAMADVHVRIPTTTAVDSLNVAVAVGIAVSRLLSARLTNVMSGG